MTHQLAKLESYVSAAADMLRIKPCAGDCVLLKTHSPALAAPYIIKKCWRLLGPNHQPQTINRLLQSIYWRHRGLNYFTDWREEFLLDRHGMRLTFLDDFDNWQASHIRQSPSLIRLTYTFLSLDDPKLTVQECKYCFYYVPQAAHQAISSLLHGILSRVCKHVAINGHQLSVSFTRHVQGSYAA